MDRQSVAKIAALTGMLPKGWTLADSLAEEDIAAEAERRKRKQMERRAKRKGAAQRVANELIYKNHRRRAIRRLAFCGTVRPGRRYERFRPLEKIQADRAAICAFIAPGEAMRARPLADAAGVEWRYAERDLKWAQEAGYFIREITGREKPLPGGKASLGLWKRTEKAFEGYTPHPIHMGTYRRKAMTPEQMEMELQAETAAAIARMQAKIEKTILTRDGKPAAPPEQRRRRAPVADRKRIQANRAIEKARVSRLARAPGARLPQD